VTFYLKYPYTDNVASEVSGYQSNDYSSPIPLATVAFSSPRLQMCTWRAFYPGGKRAAASGKHSYRAMPPYLQGVMLKHTGT
jgi:hypothetical protein